MELLPVILIITNAECSHCNVMRGTGVLKDSKLTKSLKPTIAGKYSWDDMFFKKLLSGNLDDTVQRFRVYEVHFKSMRNSNSETVLEFSEFQLKNNKVIRYSAKFNNNKLILLKDIDSVSGSKPITGELDSVFNKKTTLVDIIKYKIPNGIFPNFIAYYPEIIFFNPDIWNNSLLGTDKIYGYISGIKLKLSDSNIYEINRDSAPNPSDDPIINAGRFHILGSDYGLLLPILTITEEVKPIIVKNPVCVKLSYKIVGK